MTKLTKRVVTIMLFVCLSLTAMITTKTFGAAAAPTNLSLSISGDEYTVSWKAVTGAKSYNVYRSNSRYGTYTQIKSNITATTYTDTNSTSCYYEVTAVTSAGETTKSEPISKEISLFGKGVYIFEQGDNTSTIQTIFDDTFKKQETNQFGSERYVYLFKPGTYSNSLKVSVGFYTQVAGLGILPTDTQIGNIYCPANWMRSRLSNGDVNFNATCNFWRSAENLTVNSNTLWAVSQGTAFRRMNIKGDLAIQHYGGWASGGFMADTAVSGTVTAWSQQQWLTRNSSCRNWEGGVWNMNYVGMEDKSAPQGTWPGTPHTTLDETPVIQEKPFLIVDGNDEYAVFVPEIRKDAKGTSWKDGAEGKTISIDKFYIAKPGVSAATINAELAKGKHLIFTPGIYEISEAIRITNADTIVMGLGYATIKPTGTNQCMIVSDVGGVKVSGILFDAGRKNSPSLVTVGTKGNNIDNKENPILLADLYFRVGGADEIPCKCDVCIVINSNDVIGDNFWVWRADHGKGVGWTKNTSKNGVIVNGNNVTCYALMVEHFQQYQTIWNGDNGKVYMYQCEIPYDVPSQASWKSDTGYGYAGYYVTSGVKSHLAYGLGVYSNFTGGQAFLQKAFVVPDKPDVKIYDACAVVLGGKGGIDHVINNTGAGILTGGSISKVISYVNGKAVTEQDITKRDSKQYITMTNISNVPESKVYTGKIFAPKPVIQFRGINLREGIDYTVSYKNNKEIGKATVTINGKGMFKSTKKVTFKIVPGKPVVKVKGEKRKLKLSFKKVTGAGGYEAVYANNKKFKKKTVIDLKKSKKKTIKKLAKGKYYVKVRAYKKVNKKKVYGKYCKAIKVTVK